VCAPNEVDVLRFERTVLGKLRMAYLPTAGSDLKTRIVRILQDRLVLPQEPLVDVDELRRRGLELERKTDQALENLGLVGHQAAVALGAKIETWSAERGRIEETLRAAAKRTANASTRIADFEQTADQILGLLWQLEEVGMHSPAVERRRLFHATVRRIDLSFETVPPKPGRKRARHHFTGASVQANGLLAEASRALCLVKAPRAGEQTGNAGRAVPHLARLGSLASSGAASTNYSADRVEHVGEERARLLGVVVEPPREQPNLVEKGRVETPTDLVLRCPDMPGHGSNTPAAAMLGGLAGCGPLVVSEVKS
jgi:hypothetical protein